MARTSDVMDEILVETRLSESDLAQPGTSIGNAEVEQPQSKRPRTSGKSGVASKKQSPYIPPATTLNLAAKIHVL